MELEDAIQNNISITLSVIRKFKRKAKEARNKLLSSRISDQTKKRLRLKYQLFLEQAVELEADLKTLQEQ